jgi:pimeloyl-ACP methyl ester carboxylesterase
MADSRHWIDDAGGVRMFMDIKKVGEEIAMKVLQWIAAVAFVVAGIALLCVPSRGQLVKAAVPVAAAPTRFTVVDAGTVGKPDVVLIPGLGSGRAVWEAEAKLLALNYRVHLLQVAGFAGVPAGANAADGKMLAGIVEELHTYITANKMHPVVVGHSLGGLLTLMLAEKYPADLSRMAIVDTLPYYAVLFNPAATVETMKPQAEVMRQQIVATPADQFDVMQQSVIPALVLNKDAQKLIEAGDMASDRAVFADAMYEDLITDLRGDIATIKTPMLLIYPYDATVVKDPASIDAVYANAYKSKPNVTLVRIDGSRHFIMYDQPAKLDAALEGFLK